MMSFVPYLLIALIAIVAGIVVGFSKYRKIKKSRNVGLALKNTWGHIDVEFEACEVISREYYEELQEESFPTRREMLDSFSPSTDRSTKIKKDVCVIVYRHQNLDGGIFIYRSDPIYLSEDHVRHLLFDKKQTKIYVSPTNSSLYYFDLDFLR